MSKELLKKILSRGNSSAKLETSLLSNEELVDKITGCIFGTRFALIWLKNSKGGAIGDAIGLASEFLFK
jgi:hypothetical protein